MFVLWEASGAEIVVPEVEEKVCVVTLKTAPVEDWICRLELEEV